MYVYTTYVYDFKLLKHFRRMEILFLDFPSVELLIDSPGSHLFSIHDSETEPLYILI